MPEDSLERVMEFVDYLRFFSINVGLGLPSIRISLKSLCDAYNNSFCLPPGVFLPVEFPDPD